MDCESITLFRSIVQSEIQGSKTSPIAKECNMNLGDYSMNKLNFLWKLLGLFFSLTLIACNNSPIQTATQEIPASPTKTNSPSATPTPQGIPTQYAEEILIPSTTPMPTPSPTRPKSFIQGQKELGIIWGINTLTGEFINPSEDEDLPLLILRDFGPKVVYQL